MRAAGEGNRMARAPAAKVTRAGIRLRRPGGCGPRCCRRAAGRLSGPRRGPGRCLRISWCRRAGRFWAGRARGFRGRCRRRRCAATCGRRVLRWCRKSSTLRALGRRAASGFGGVAVKVQQGLAEKRFVAGKIGESALALEMAHCGNDSRMSSATRSTSGCIGTVS